MDNQQKFNSVFAYWDKKDKVVQQAKPQPQIKKQQAKPAPTLPEKSTTDISNIEIDSNNTKPSINNESTISTSAVNSYENVVKDNNLINNNNNNVINNNNNNNVINNNKDELVEENEQNILNSSGSTFSYGSTYGSCYNVVDNQNSDSYRSLYSSIRDSYNSCYSSYRSSENSNNETLGNNAEGYGYSNEGDQVIEHKIHNIPNVNVFDIYSKINQKYHSSSGGSTTTATAVQKDDDEDDDADWNSRFQNIIDMPESGEKYHMLSTIVNDFVHCASTFGQIIIAERYLPNDQKTVQPLSMGGVAGGEKYCINNIVFKFVVDVEIVDGVWMYGDKQRSDEKAQKSAGHELKGLNHIFDLGSKIIRIPLMAIIDFAGYRLLAVSKLPVDKKTIVYGSNNGGVTVHNSDPKVEQEMAKLASRLNLKGHHVGLSLEKPVFLYGPGDIEVHLGHDGRYYMIDFARVFPPEYSGLFKENIGREIFYSLLRPELVERYEIPLSSDAFTAWQHEKESKESNQEVIDATSHLHDVVISECVYHINEMIVNENQIENKYFEQHHVNRDLEYYQQQLSNIDKLLQTIHSKGINYRYLGVICQKLTDYDTRKLLYTELISRVWKKIIKDRLRDLVEISNRPSDKSILIFTELFNLLLNKSKAAKKEFSDFWRLNSIGSFKYTASAAFPNCLDSKQRNEKFDIRNSFDTKLLVIKLIKMFNIRIRTDSYENFINLQSYVISIHDIEGIGAVVKYPMIVDFSYGSSLLFDVQAGMEENRDNTELQRLMTMSQRKLQSALASMPLSSKVIIKQVTTYILRSELTTNFLESIHLLEKGAHLLKQNPDIDPNTQALDGLILLKLATFKLFNQFDFQTFNENLAIAMQRFESSLEQDSDYAELYIKQLLPFDIPPVGDDMDLAASTITEQKRNDLLSLVYLMSMCIEESKLRDFLFETISQVRVINHFEIPFSVEQIFDSDTLYQLFNNIKNVNYLSIANFGLHHQIALPITKLQHLATLRMTKINFVNSNASDTDQDPSIQSYNQFLKQLLKGAPQLTSLSLSTNYLDDNEFEGVAELMGNIEHLKLIQCELSDKSFNELATYVGPNLKSLDIYSRYSGIGDKGICNLLRSAKSLTSLGLQYRISSETAQEIIPLAINLEKLNLCDCSSISAECLANIVGASENIVDLDLSFTSADDRVIEALAKHGAKNLSKLKYEMTSVGHSEDSNILSTLLAMEVDLKTLHMSRFNGNTRDLWKLLSHLPNLTELRTPEYLHVPNLMKEYNANDYEPTGGELAELRVLELMLANISIGSLMEIFKLSPMLESVSLSAATILNDMSYVLEMDDDFFNQFAPLCVNLKHLNLANTATQRRHVELIISQAKSLTSMDIYNCKAISNQTIYDLSQEYPYIKFQ